MENDIVGAVAAFLTGAVISFINYKLSDFFMAKSPGKFSYISILRSIIGAGFIVLLFFLAPYTPWDRTYLLIGAALGTTLPMIFFTYKLIKKPLTSDTNKEEKEESSDG